jgi:hypothetical protein
MQTDFIIPRSRNYDLKDGHTRRCFMESPKSENGPFWLQSYAMSLYVSERDIDPTTTSISSEPGLIKSSVGKYYPDFRVGWQDRTWSIVEIKSARHRYDRVLLARYRRIGEECTEAGFKFDLIFTDRLYRQPKRNNVSLIHYYKDTEVTQRDVDSVMGTLAQQPEMTLGELTAACPGITSAKLYALTAKGILWVNLFKPVNKQAMIRARRPLLAVAA